MENIVQILKKKQICFPSILLENYKKMNLNEKEVIFLIFLMNDDLFFNPKHIAETLDWTMKEVLEIVDSLTRKDLLKIEVKKEDNICQEYLDLNLFYEQLAFQLVGDKSSEKTFDTTIFDTFEKEFGRPLSPIELEIIKGWEESNFSEELILLALKEAIYNGVFRLNYIDKILFEWKKKGIKTKQDVEKNNRQFNERKKSTEEVFEYDWLNE